MSDKPVRSPDDQPLLRPIASRATIPLGDLFLVFDTEDPGNHWMLLRRDKTDTRRDCIVVDWSGGIPINHQPATEMHLDGVRREEEDWPRYHTFELDQNFAAALEMACRHGRTGIAWFDMIEKALGYCPRFGDGDQRHELVHPVDTHLSRWLEHIEERGYAPQA